MIGVVMPTAGPLPAGLLAAVPDAWAIGVPIAVLVVQIIQVAIVGVLTAKTRKIDTLEGDLKRTVEQLIETKLSSLESRVQSPVAVLTQRVSQVELRLSAGDQHFKRADDRSHQLEVNILKELQTLREHMATKDDLDRLRDELKREERNRG